MEQSHAKKFSEKPPERKKKDGPLTNMVPYARLEWRGKTKRASI